MVESIAVQVGKTGALTPVANLKAVQLAGTTVRRASLHNFDEMQRLDVRPGDTVMIEKAGEIIPQVVEVKKEFRPAGAEPFPVPKNCPNCGTEVVKDEAGVYVRCPNPDCFGMLKERLRYFAGRDQMDIEHLGVALIEQLIDAGLVKTFADIYRLKRDDLTALERMGDKSAQNVLDGIEASKTRPLWRFIAALGIRHVGGQSAEVLAEHFGSLDALMNAGQDQLEAIDQVGPVMAESVYQYFHNPRHRMVIDDLLAAGVRPQPPAPESDGRPPRQDRRCHRNAQGLLAPAGRAGHPGGRRQGLRQRQQEDGLCPSRRGPRQQAAEGPGARRRGHRRGTVQPILAGKGMMT